MGRLSVIVAILLMLSAISLVTARYQSRQLFVESERVQA
ncbi:MAG: cell division protein FtsL, partial [Burkholderiaceae bacterium]